MRNNTDKLNKINVCIVRLGIMGEKYLKCYHQNSNVSIAGVADININRTAELVSKIQNDIPIFNNVEEMISSVSCDVVHVSTPDHLHYKPVMLALKHNKYVIVEKPLAISCKEAKDIVELAEKKIICNGMLFSQMGQSLCSSF